MKFSHNIQIGYYKLFSPLVFAYLAVVWFGHQPVCSAAAISSTVTSSTASPPSSITAAPYVRKSRDVARSSATSAPESVDGQEQFNGLASVSSNSGGGFFPYPSFKHKYQTRVSRFHGDHPGPATRTYSIRSMTSFPKLHPLGGILSMKSSETRNPTLEELENEEQEPTFTPFIGARALSNIPQFFQHLRSNLEALQLDEEDEESEEADSGKYERPLGQPGDAMLYYGNEDEGRAPIIPHLPENKPMRWMPATAGMTGRAHIRNFVNDPVEQELFYRKPFVNPARNVYEFGLG